MRKIDRHKQALAYGEIPPSFQRSPMTTNRLPDEHLNEKEMLEKFFEADLRKMVIKPGLVR